MNTQQTTRLTLIGTVSGLSLPEDVSELSLDKAKIFRNPAGIRKPGSPSEIGANTAIYSGEGKERHLVGDVATYLIECGIDAPSGQLGHTRIRGSGGVMIGTLADSEAITLTTGKEAHSAVSVSSPLGKAWDTPTIMQNVFDKAVLPLRLLTKARILAFPTGVLGDESRQEVLNAGLHKSCPVPTGTGLEVGLSNDDCNRIEAFSKKLAKANLEEFEVPIFLFSRSFQKTDVADRALDLIITLESLLSGSSESIAYKIAFRASCLTAKSERDRWEAFKFTKETYGFRNPLVHGNKKTLRKARAALEQRMEKVEELTRSCLKLACLLEAKRTKLPSGHIVRMRNEETIDEYILTHCLKKRRLTPLDSFPEVGKLRQFTRVL